MQDNLYFLPINLELLSQQKGRWSSKSHSAYCDFE